MPGTLPWAENWSFCPYRSAGGVCPHPTHSLNGGGVPPPLSSNPAGAYQTVHLNNHATERHQFLLGHIFCPKRIFFAHSHCKQFPWSIVLDSQSSFGGPHGWRPTSNRWNHRRLPRASPTLFLQVRCSSHSALSHPHRPNFQARDTAGKLLSCRSAILVLSNPLTNINKSARLFFGHPI